MLEKKGSCHSLRHMVPRSGGVMKGSVCETKGVA